MIKIIKFAGGSKFHLNPQHNYTACSAYGYGPFIKNEWEKPIFKTNLENGHICKSCLKTHYAKNLQELQEILNPLMAEKARKMYEKERKEIMELPMCEVKLVDKPAKLYQSYTSGFTYAVLNKDRINVHAPCKCRDYIQALFWAAVFNENIEGNLSMKYNPARDGKPNLKRAEVAIYLDRDSIYSSEEDEYNITSFSIKEMKRVERLLRAVELKMGQKQNRTKVYRTNKPGVYVVSSPGKWTRSLLLVSFWSFLIRAGVVAPLEGNPIDWLLSPEKEKVHTLETKVRRGNDAHHLTQDKVIKNMKQAISRGFDFYSPKRADNYTRKPGGVSAIMHQGICNPEGID